MRRAALLLLLLAAAAYPQPSLREKIGQMIMVGFSGTVMPDSLGFDLTNRGLGGVIYFAANAQNPTQLKNLTRTLQQAARYPLFVAIDQEGGQVARLNQSNGYARTNSAYRLGTTYRSTDSTAKQAALMAQWLADAGININFAPVVDVNVNPISPAIGAKERSFSKLTADVFLHSRAFITEMNRRGVTTALKHYPGHGSATADSHLGFTDITTTWADSELTPYRSVLASGYSGMIMSGHLFNSRIDSLYPASLSNKAINGKLRGELGFNGVVITDELFMAAISANFTFDKAIELAVLAGNDVLLFSTNLKNNRSLVDSVVTIITNKIAEGKITQARIDESYNRIRLLKQSLTGTERINSSVLGGGLSAMVYPNPVAGVATVLLTVTEPGMATADLFSVQGERLGELFAVNAQPGTVRVNTDFAGLPSGIYFLRVQQAGKTAFVKVITLR